MHASPKVPKVVVALRVRIGKGMETTMLFREAFEFEILSGTCVSLPAIDLVKKWRQQTHDVVSFTSPIYPSTALSL
jgi:hypothetical protein